jgi:hypothetical protein
VVEKGFVFLLDEGYHFSLQSVSGGSAGSVDEVHDILCHIVFYDTINRKTEIEPPGA